MLSPLGAKKVCAIHLTTRIARAYTPDAYEQKCGFDGAKIALEGTLSSDTCGVLTLDDFVTLE